MGSTGLIDVTSLVHSIFHSLNLMSLKWENVEMAAAKLIQKSFSPICEHLNCMNVAEYKLKLTIDVAEQ